MGFEITPTIGQNIRTFRQAQGLTQRQLSELSGISPTQMSDYENGKKTPGLTSIAKIAQALKTSIDSLYYGNSEIQPVTTATNKGRLIANCTYELWKHDVLMHSYSEYDPTGFPFHIPANLCQHAAAVDRLLTSLDEFREHERTYSNPGMFVEQLIDSVAQEIEPTVDDYSDVPF